MAITQQQYFDAIGRAGLTMGDNVLACVNSEKKGCSPDWSVAACLLKTIKAAQVFFNMGDYSSSDSIYFYNQVTNIAGSNYSTSVINPNAQIDNITVIVNANVVIIPPLKIYIPAGSPFPFNVTAANTPGFENFLYGYDGYKQELIIDSDHNETINDVIIKENYTNSLKTVYSSLDIYGHTDDGSVTKDNIIVTLTRGVSSATGSGASFEVIYPGSGGGVIV